MISENAQAKPLVKTTVSNSIDWRKSILKEKLITEVEKPKQLGGQQCGMPIHAVIVKSEDLEIEIKVKHFRQNYKNRELATLLMELAIDELVR
jgi:hypothetical protein